MSSQTDKAKKKNSGRSCKSTGNTPVGSPSLARKAINPKTENKESKTMENPDKSSSFIDVDGISDSANILEVTTVLTKAASALTQCPCDMFDRKCIAIKCSTCSKDWHTECCNLSGVTPSVA